MIDCLFCKIVRKEIPAKFVFESDNLVAFPDIHPSADYHILIVPKEHIGGIGDLDENKADLLSEVYSLINRLVLENNLTEKSFRVVVNGGKAQHIPHIHFHLLGGKWYKFI